MMDKLRTILTLPLQGDTGSGAMIMNQDLAYKYWKDEIRTDKKCIATVADDRRVTLNESLEQVWLDHNKQLFITTTFILKCNVPYIASLNFVRRMGFQVSGRVPHHVKKQWNHHQQRYYIYQSLILN